MVRASAGRFSKWLREWRQHPDFLLHVAALATTVLLWSFERLCELAAQDVPDSLDRRLLLMLREPGHPDDPIGPRWFEGAWRDVTALGSDVVVGLITFLVVGYLIVERKHRSAILLVILVVGGSLLSAAVKLTFKRPRPEIVAHLVHVSSASFPSGHSLISAVIYPTLGALLASLSVHRRTKIYYLASALLLTLLVGFSRMYLGVHYPSDVLGGWVLGLAWSLACWLGSEVLQRRGALRGEHID